MSNKYREKNRELLAEKQRKYYQDNKEVLSKKQREYYNNHKRTYAEYKDRLSIWRKTLKGRFSQSKSKLKEKWKLTFDEYSELILEGLCHYCNKELNPMGSGLDRKNPLMDYSVDNVVPCCKNCNIMKNNFLSYEEMIVVGKALQGYWQEAHDEDVKK